MNQEPMDDITKLIKLLRKILKHHPEGKDISKWMSGEHPINLNLCFFTFVPMTAEELEEVEDMYEEYLGRMEEVTDKSRAKLEFKLSQEDIRFLKEHGLRF